MATSTSGHMIHSTVEDVSPSLSEKSTTTGGPQLAVSNKTTIQAAFPGSPMLGDNADYNATHVAGLKYRIMTNGVLDSDISEAAGYFGYATPNSDEESPSSPDLTFNGAPFVPDITTDKNGSPIASPYMPNLLPPDSFSPTADNPVPVVMTVEESGHGSTPFVGDGLRSPKAASEAFKANIKENLENPGGGVTPSQPPGSNSDPVGGF